MPPYSPELNSIERLWGVSKKRFARLLQQAVLSDRPINSIESFDELVRESLNFDLQQIGQLMKTNYLDVLETVQSSADMLNLAEAAELAQSAEKIEPQTHMPTAHAVQYQH